MKTTIEHKGIELQATTFDGATAGQRYVTPAGYEVEVIATHDDHATVRTNKGKELRTACTAPCYGPIPVDEAATDSTTETDAPADAPAPAETEPAPKRKRDMSIEDLRAEYLRVIGRETGSTDRRYLLWKLSEAAKGKITVGAIEKRAPRDKADMQVLPLGMERTVVARLDAAWKALGFKSRMAFLRDAMVAYLRDQEGAEAGAAADAIEAEGF